MKNYIRPDVVYTRLTPEEGVMSIPDISKGDGTPPWLTSDSRDDDR